MALLRGAMRLAWATTRGRLRAAAGADPGRLQRRVRIDPDWRRHDAGGAARLGPRETISVSRPGRWQEHDPLRVTETWRRPARSAGLALWAGLLGLAWWQGASRGRGPLAALRYRPEPAADRGGAGE